MEILIDFDGTVVTHEFPEIGKDIGAIPVLKDLVKKGHKLILFTMRSDKTNVTSDHGEIIVSEDKHLSNAVKWFHKNKIPLYGIQTNPTQHTWTSSPKAYGQLIIDDTALGCPLKINTDISSRPYVDWTLVRKLLYVRGIL